MFCKCVLVKTKVQFNKKIDILICLSLLFAEILIRKLNKKKILHNHSLLNSFVHWYRRYKSVKDIYNEIGVLDIYTSIIRISNTKCFCSTLAYCGKPNDKIASYIKTKNIRHNIITKNQVLTN